MPLGKTRPSCTLGMWERILPSRLPLLPGLAGLFDLGLNSEQQQGRSQWGRRFLIPVTPNASRTITQPCSSYQHWKAFENESAGSCLLPSHSFPKRSEIKMRKMRLMSHMQEPTQIFFLLTSPSTGTFGFIAPLQLSKDKHTLQSRLFSARLLHCQEGLWNPPCT